MAIVQNTLIGRARNKVGGTVFSTWKGINVLKSKPLTVAQPPSDARTAQQSVIRQLNALGRQIIGTIRQAFNEVSARSTNWASWMKYNSPVAFDISGAVASLRPNQITASRGTLVNPPAFDRGTVIVRSYPITWTDNSGQAGANASDQFVWVAITAAGEIYSSVTTDTRADEASTIVLPGATTVGSFTTIGFFINVATKKASDSVVLT